LHEDISDVIKILNLGVKTQWHIMETCVLVKNAIMSLNMGKKSLKPLVKIDEHVNVMPQGSIQQVIFDSSMSVKKVVVIIAKLKSLKDNITLNTLSLCLVEDLTILATS
jgi:hypothetical protein